MKNNQKQYHLYPWRTFSAALGLSAYMITTFVGRDSQFMESIYSRGIYVVLRRIWDFTSGLSPIGLIYIFFLTVFVFILFKIIRYSKKGRQKDKRGWKIKAVDFATRLTSTVGILVFLFYILWGFNYNRVRLERQLNLDVRPLNSEEIREEMGQATDLVEEAQKLLNTPTAMQLNSLPEGLEDLIRSSLKGVLNDLGYPSTGKARVKSFWPGDLMMRFNVAGIYLPYLGEAYIPHNTLPVEKPFALAHEMAHVYGVTDEGTANFLAYLACEASKDPAVRYSGRFCYWMYIAGEFLRLSPPEYRKLWETLPEGMKADLQAISRHRQKYKGPLRKIGQKVQQRYLKSQGVREGIRSYNRLVVLLAAWNRLQQENTR